MPMKSVLLVLTLSVAGVGQLCAAEPFKKPPKWVTGCESKMKDQFGDAKRQYCFLAVSNDRGASLLMDDNSFVMDFEVILEVDARGVRIMKPLPRRLCGSKGSPTRIAVDGQRIDRLPVAKQVQAMMAGQRLVWEEQGEWPGCSIAPFGTYLDGMREAVEALNSKWQALAR
jgi:hypothetical protein